MPLLSETKVTRPLPDFLISLDELHVKKCTETKNVRTPSSLDFPPLSLFRAAEKPRGIYPRYVNAAASKRGLSKEALLSCDWAAVQPSGADLADWPLLQSLALPPAARRRAAARYPTAAAPPPLSPRTAPASDGGVEETKQSDSSPGAVARGDGARAVAGDGGCDEWVVATPDAPAGGDVRVRPAPLDYGKTVWRLSPGQLARLSPSQQLVAVERGGAAWRFVTGAGGEEGWLSLPGEDAPGSPGAAPALERFWAYRCMLDWFSAEAARGVGSGGSGGAVEGRGGSSPPGAADNLWLSLRQRKGAAAPGDGPSPFSAAHLEGDSDALLLSTVDAGAPPDEEGGPLLVTGKWKVGLVTDTLTITTRTSGCTRVVTSPAAEDGGSGGGGGGGGGAGGVPAALSSPDSGGGAKGGGGGDQTAEPLPVLVDGVVFGFRAVDGLLVVARALSRPSGAGVTSGTAHMEAVERQAVAWLGAVDEGAEVCFSVLDDGDEVTFSCREVGKRRRTATVRARCRDTWGPRGRVALGARRRPASKDSMSGWVRVTSVAHGATVRSGMSIDADAVVGRIPCGTVVPYDNAILYHSPGAPDRDAIEPVIRYRCMATVTTPAGWISERGRYAGNPYRICERVRPRPKQPPAQVSHVSIARATRSLPVAGGARPPTGRRDPPPGRQPGGAAPRVHGEGETSDDRGDGDGDGERELGWQRRLDELPVLPVRFHLLQQLNRDVAGALRYVDLSQGDSPWSIAGLLSRCRRLVFSGLKQELWQAELARTSRPLASAQRGPEGAPPPPPPLPLELRLSRGRAARGERPGARQQAQRGGQKGRLTLFGQAFFALRHVKAEAFRLRPGEVLYSTVFVGEHAHDAGGEAHASFCCCCCWWWWCCCCCFALGGGRADLSAGPGPA